MFSFFLFFIIVYCDIRLQQSCSSDSDKPGQFWDGQQCLNCKQNVCYCKELSGCDSCQDNYYLSLQNTCELCPVGCKNCCENQYEILIICTKCQTNYKLVQGVCLYQKGCLSFTKHGRCAKCDQNGYFLSSVGICDSCSQGCQQCLTKEHCIQCSPGFILQQQFQKSDNTPSMICIGCESQNFTGCASCIFIDTKNTIMQCARCNLGYYQTQEYQCLQCSSNCLECEDPRQSTSICRSCENEYILSNDKTKCQGCHDKFPNCNTCLIEQEGLQIYFICIQCKNGYYKNGDQCTLCQAENTVQIGYLYCDSENEPTQCQDGYLLVINSDSTTSYCLENKYSCRQMDLNMNCISCLENEYLYQPLEQQQIQCVNCSSVIENCQDCIQTQNNQLKCQNCINNYYLQTNGQCQICSDQCLQCDQNKCLVCNDTYYVSNNNCLACPQTNCKTCGFINGTLGCNKCLDGYGLSESNTCWSCLSGCSQCDNNQTQCNSCKANYHFNQQSKTCQRYPDYCLNVYANGTCSLCQTFTNQSSDQNNYSYFYQTEGGICRLCNDFSSGQFSCPQYCQSSPQLNVTYVYQSKLSLIGISLMMYQIFMF